MGILGLCLRSLSPVGFWVPRCGYGGAAPHSRGGSQAQVVPEKAVVALPNFCRCYWQVGG